MRQSAVGMIGVLASYWFTNDLVGLPLRSGS
jgi:hypothetical protein